MNSDGLLFYGLWSVIRATPISSATHYLNTEAASMVLKSVIKNLAFKNLLNKRLNIA